MSQFNIASYHREKHFCLQTFLVIKISFVYFLCKNYNPLSSPLYKVTAFFASNPPLKIAQLPPPGERGVYYVHTFFLSLIVGGRVVKMQILGKKSARSLIILPLVHFIHPTLSDNQAQKSSIFQPLRGLGFFESVKKGKFVTKIFFKC